MHRLLALVLSVSILVSSISPALGQVGPVGRGVAGIRRGVPAVTNRNLLPTRMSAQINRRVMQQTMLPMGWVQSHILSGNVNGLAQQILQQSAALRAPMLRNDFVTLSLMPNAVTDGQRLQAVTAYQVQLQETSAILNVPQTDLDSFLVFAQQHPADLKVTAVKHVLADASALGLVGTKESAAVLLDFYKHAQGTLFEDTAALITARGLLHMQAYEALETFLSEHTGKEVLAGTAAYIRTKGMPIEVPSELQIDHSLAANEKLAVFLGDGFLPNRLHADPSVQATELWVNLNVAQPQVQPAPVVSEAQVLARSIQPAQFAKQGVPQVTATTPHIEPLMFSSNPAVSVNAAPVVSVTAVPQTETSVTTERRSSKSGILYSGIRVFAIAEMGKRFFSWLRRQFKKEQSTTVPYEEPGLHESNVRPVFAQVDLPARASIGGDLVGADSEIHEVSVGVDGFKLTVEGTDKVEHILHNVDLTVSSDLKNFSPEYNRLALDTDYIFELRNQTVPAKRPDHFYFALSIRNGEFDTFLQGANDLHLTRPMRIKIQRSGTPRNSVTIPVYDRNLRSSSLMAEVDASLLSGIKDPQEGHIWYNGQTLYFQDKYGTLTELQNAFVRLPKAESKYWTKIFEANPETKFRLGVFSTMGKMVPVTYLVPSLQIGLGKTLAPEMHDTFGIEKDTASNIMLGINNVLPALMLFVHPLMKQYGEAAVFRVGSAMFTVGGLVALATGLYGHVGGGEVTNLQLTGFIVSSVLIALGTNVTRFVQNLLMSANRGIVPQASSFQKAQEVTDAAPVVYNARHLAKRAWEVATKKSSKSLRDVIYYQRGAMFKNLGTMLFLSFPMFANALGKMVGLDLGLDFSASYVPYTLYSLYTLRQVYKTRYKDAFPMNKTVLSNNLQDLQNSTAASISQVPPAELTSTHPVLVEAAKQLKGAIDALVPVESRQTKTTINNLTIKHETEVGAELEELLLLSGRTPQEAQAARQSLQQAFDVLGRRDVKWYKVAKMKGLPAALSAMTLATFGELGFSNGLAFAMRDMGLDGTAATGVVGLLLYGCMFGWRIIGNVLSQRMSGGSMYALSSTASIVGPAMAALAVPTGNISLLVAGTITACFGISNFFSQMYEYMVGLYPKYKREIALLINFTMPLAALPVGAMKSGAFEAIPGLDMAICGAALAGSVALTPGMLANSSMVQAAKFGWQQLKNKVHQFFHRGGDVPPTAEVPAN